MCANLTRSFAICTQSRNPTQITLIPNEAAFSRRGRAAKSIYSLVYAVPAADETALSVDMIVSVSEQVLALLNQGKLFAQYSISSSKFGAGGSFANNRGPFGRHSHIIGHRCPDARGVL